MTGWLRALLFLLGGVIAAGGTAYFTGLLDPWLAPHRVEIVDAPKAAPAPEPAAPEPSTPEPSAAQTDSDETLSTARQDRLVASSFDLLRVEPDGSVLVAGKAGSKALVELLSGETVVGSAEAGEEGDFVIVLDEQLPAGDYQLVLRTTVPGDEPVLSTSTAIVSVPKTADGDVLAMIDEPGAPAKLVTVPQAQPESPAAAVQEQAGDVVAPAEADQQATIAEAPVDEASVDEAPVDEAMTGGKEDSPDVKMPEAAETKEPAAPVVTQTQPAEAPTAAVVVEAIEIEGDTIFIAGRATGKAASGHVVRAYADAALLGEAAVSEGDRFLVEAKRDLAVGNYMIRADLIDKAGNVVARATVPFEREPGEAIAAVAPAPAATPAAEITAQETPASQAEAAASETGAENVKVAPAVDDAGVTPAAPLQRADGAVIIRRGDSLWRISRRVYGHGIRYSTIYLANQDQISNPDRIWPGQVFALPGETPEGDQADLEAIGEQSVEPQAQEPAGR